MEKPDKNTMIDRLIEDDFNTIVECGQTDYLFSVLTEYYNKQTKKEIKEAYNARNFEINKD